MVVYTGGRVVVYTGGRVVVYMGGWWCMCEGGWWWWVGGDVCGLVVVVYVGGWVGGKVGGGWMGAPPSTPICFPHLLGVSPGRDPVIFKSNHVDLYYSG